MKRTMVMIAAALVLTGWSAGAQDASRRVLADELLTMMNMPKTFEKSMEMIKQMIPAQVEEMAKSSGGAEAAAKVSAQTVKMIAMMEKEWTWEKVKGEYVGLYAEMFTEDELKGVISFYKTQAGMAFINKQPELVKRSMELSRKMMDGILPKIQELLKEVEPSQSPSTEQPKENK
ncbi:MAG: DUF2059 domain-containing protein [Pseudomonadota bacterium]